MNKTLSNTVIVLMLVSAWLGQDLQAMGGNFGEVGSQITVRVANYAEVDRGTLQRAKRVAANIFAKIGVKLVLVDVDLSKEEPYDKTTLFMDILTAPMAARLGLHETAMGLAPGKASQPNRNKVYVFAHAAERLFQQVSKARMAREIRWTVGRGDILGHIMAHEMGHILLNLNAHPGKGLMRGDWNLRELQRAAVGHLIFTSNEGKQIRQEVELRQQLAADELAGHLY